MELNIYQSHLMSDSKCRKNKAGEKSSDIITKAIRGLREPILLNDD
ncbi:MAG: hypothetical protein WAV76_16725 [Bacteroidota bacterium]